MKTEIIAVGTELLMGYTINTNSAEISQALLEIGLGTYYQQVIGDNPMRMAEAFALAGSRSDIIIVSGGLGPTQDDITKDVMAEYLGTELVEDPAALAKIAAYFEKQGREMSHTEHRQSLTFAGGETFVNQAGLAAGAAFKRQQDNGDWQHFIVVPGPPFEMRQMLTDSVIPYLRRELTSGDAIESMYLNFFDIGESRVAELLDDMIAAQTNPTIAVYARPMRVTIRLTASATTREEAQALNQQVADQISQRLAKNFLGYGEDFKLENYIIETLKEKELTIASAESLTGGLFLSQLIEVAGASEVVKGGFVTYQTETKHSLLNISEALIEEHGVVSEEVARAMAIQAQVQAEADIGVSFTGVAGPDPIDGHEAGTVYVGLAVGDVIDVRRFNIVQRPRNVVREIAVVRALNMIKTALDE